jgi:hypothetical protein
MIIEYQKNHTCPFVIKPLKVGFKAGRRNKVSKVSFVIRLGFAISAETVKAGSSSVNINTIS